LQDIRVFFCVEHVGGTLEVNLEKAKALYG